MSSKWEQYTIKDACDLITGFPFKSKSYLNEGTFKVVRGDNVKTGFIQWGEKTKCWNQISEKLEKYLLKENDIVIGMDGSKVGENRAIIGKNDLPSLLAQRVACLRSKKHFNQNYIKYVILSKNFQYYVDMVKTGTSIPHISLTQISEFPFNAPDYEKQTVIANILLQLDNKININKKINHNLFKQAEEIYKEFIKKPKDKQKKVKLKEIASIQNGYAFKSKSYVDEGCPVIRTLNITNNFVNEENLAFLPFSFYCNEKYNKFHLNCFDTLLVMVGSTIGKIGLITEINLPALQNQNMWRFRPLNRNMSPFLIYFFVKDANNHMKKWTSGSARSFYKKDIFNEYLCTLPSEEYIIKFDEYVSPLFYKINYNLMEISILKKIRNILLPKLMSGEIDVSKY